LWRSVVSRLTRRCFFGSSEGSGTGEHVHSDYSPDTVSNGSGNPHTGKIEGTEQGLSSPALSEDIGNGIAQKQLGRAAYLEPGK
jgi:hypothetical protein